MHRLLVLMVSGCAAAHDLYLMPDRFRVTSGQTLTVGIHAGDSFPESEARVTLARLRDTRVHAAAGTGSIQNLRATGNQASGNFSVPRGGDLVVAVRTIPNFIELAPDKFLSYLQHEGLKEVVEWRDKNGQSAKPGRERYSKFAKALVLAGAPDDYYRQVIGFPIEIVPEQDPYRLKPGESLSVRVLFRGSPASDLQIEAAWTEVGGAKIQSLGRTDSQGRIAVPLVSAGKWRLHTVKMERCPDPAAADWESFWASLTFEIR